LYFVTIGPTEQIGVAVKFIAGTLYVIPVDYLYKSYNGAKSIVAGLVIGTFGMAIFMSVLNYLIVLPAYSLLVGTEMNDTIKLTSVVAGVLPFNFIKGVIVSLLFIPLFMKLRDWIESKHASMMN